LLGCYLCGHDSFESTTAVGSLGLSLPGFVFVLGILGDLLRRGNMQDYTFVQYVFYRTQLCRIHFKTKTYINNATDGRHQPQRRYERIQVIVFLKEREYYISFAKEIWFLPTSVEK